MPVPHHPLGSRAATVVSFLLFIPWLCLMACHHGGSAGPCTPIPSVTSITPTSAAALGPAFTLTVDGADFVSNSIVRWKGNDRTTTFVSNTQLQAAIPASDLRNQGTAEVTVFSPIGGGCSSAAATFTINAPSTAKFAYVTNPLAGAVIGFTINSSTGELSLIGADAAGNSPLGLAADPAGRFLYVANFDSNNVSMFTINSANGELTSLGTVGAGIDPVAVAVHPSGQFAYVANEGSNNVTQYSINTITGELTSLGTVAAGANPTDITVDPTGQFAYAANFGSGTVSLYSVNTTTGRLTSEGEVAAGGDAESIVVHPSGELAYAGNLLAGTVSVFSVNTNTGALTL
ncbi:MAG: lactonase family protein, partial [Candidatus Acidiferrales bacterium]